MDKSGKENLREFFGHFLDERDAREAAEDIRKADELFNAYPAPQPSEGTVAKVKSSVAIALRRRRTTSIQWRVLAAAGVAAVLVVGAFLSLRFRGSIQTGREQVQYASAIPDRVWEGSDITSDDAELAVLTAEVETLRNALSGAQIYDNGYGNGAVNELEMELIEISGDLWKG